MQFDLYSQYYDLIYLSKDYADEAQKVISKLDHPRPLLLELGSGSGGHANVLTQLGCTVTGIDLSHSMVQIANEKKIDNFKAFQGDIRDFSLNEEFDAAISLFHVISYLSSNSDVNDCLRAVHRHLKPNGIFIFDCWFAPSVYHQGFEIREKNFENEHIHVRRISSATLNTDENTAVVHFDITVSDKHSPNQQLITEDHKMRFFSIPEIRLFAENCGFKLIEVFDLHSENTPSLDTWAITVKLQKK
jgi:SAM-dependent methyltransferase